MSNTSAEADIVDRKTQAVHESRDEGGNKYQCRMSWSVKAISLLNWKVDMHIPDKGEESPARSHHQSTQSEPDTEDVSSGRTPS